MTAPPAASTASATREPAGRRCSPGFLTFPTTWTTTPAAQTFVGAVGVEALGLADGKPLADPAPTGAAPADSPVGPAREPPPGARTVPSPAAQATRNPKSATATATTTASPMTASRPGSHRAPTNASGRRNQPRALDLRRSWTSSSRSSSGTVGTQSRSGPPSSSTASTSAREAGRVARSTSDEP